MMTPAQSLRGDDAREIVPTAAESFCNPIRPTGGDFLRLAASFARRPKLRNQYPQRDNRHRPLARIYFISPIPNETTAHRTIAPKLVCTPTERYCLEASVTAPLRDASGLRCSEISGNGFGVAETRYPVSEAIEIA